MDAHLPRRSVGIFAFLAAISSLVACSDRNQPIGVGGLAPSRLDGLVRPEERRAVELSREIPGLAGFFYDTAGNLIVAVKAVGGSAMSRALLQPIFRQELSRAHRRNPAADLIVRGAQFTFLELRQWRDRLLGADILTVPGVVWMDLDEAANRVVLGLGVGGDPGVVRRMAQDLGVPAEAIDFERGAPYDAQTTLHDQFRPLQGAIQIQRVSGSSRATCTLGFTALWNNQQVFVTAGHCSPNLMGTDSVAQYQPIAPLTAAESASTTPVGREIFRYSEVCGKGVCSYSDASIYGPVSTQAWSLGRIARPSFGCFPGPCSPPAIGVSGSWVIDTTRASFVVNDLVSQIGSASGWSQGYVTRTCVDVSPSHGATYYCQMFASYGANDGDSGSPILLDIQGGADTTVTLGGVHSGRSGSNSVFSPWSGIVRDYAGLVVSAPPPDTSQPPMPDSLNLPIDSVLTVTRPGDTLPVYYRSIVAVGFIGTASGTAIRSILQRYSAVVIGGAPYAPPNGEYIIQVPDPGTTFGALDSLAQRLESEPTVDHVGLLALHEVWDPRYRHPNDGPDSRRSDWRADSLTAATRPRVAIRAPLAWGCETGSYNSDRVTLAVLDLVFQAVHSDFAGSQVTISRPRGRLVPEPFLADPVIRSHGTAVAGIMAATGDNGQGIAGMVWSANITLYAYGDGQAVQPGASRRFAEMLSRATAGGMRLVATSTGFGLSEDDREVRDLRRALRRYLGAGSGNIFVYAGGEAKPGRNPQRITLQQLQTTTSSAFSALDKAVAQLYDSLPGQIIIVVGSDEQGGLWTQSDYYSGATVLAAPATDVETLADVADFPAGTFIRSGTSYAAPFVAGVAAQLLATDPTLTGSQVTDYIRRGSRASRWNSQTGQVELPHPVAGTSDAFQLDAYGALTLLANERAGISLCGNRVWVTNSVLLAERDTATHSTEQLANLGEPAAQVDVRQGGRRIELYAPISFRDRAFELRNGQWTETLDTATSPFGGAYLSLFQLSHERDSAVDVQPQYGDGFIDLDVDILDTVGGSLTRRTINTIHVPLPSSGSFIEVGNGDSAFDGMTTTADWRYAYSPQGDRVFVSVTLLQTQTTGTSISTCPWADPNDPNPPQCTSVFYQTSTQSTAIHALTVPTGTDAVLWTLSGQQAYWLAGSEDGSQLVTAEGSMTQASVYEPLPGPYPPTGFRINAQPQVVSGCLITYRVAASGGTQLHGVTSTDACLGQEGQGTMAPVRMMPQ
jgi:subtilisin family serine protease